MCPDSKVEQAIPSHFPCKQKHPTLLALSWDRKNDMPLLLIACLHLSWSCIVFPHDMRPLSICREATMVRRPLALVLCILPKDGLLSSRKLDNRPGRYASKSESASRSVAA